MVRLLVLMLGLSSLMVAGCLDRPAEMDIIEAGPDEPAFPTGPITEWAWNTTGDVGPAVWELSLRGSDSAECELDVIFSSVEHDPFGLLFAAIWYEWADGSRGYTAYSTSRQAGAHVENIIDTRSGGDGAVAVSERSLLPLRGGLVTVAIMGSNFETRPDFGDPRTVSISFVCDQPVEAGLRGSREVMFLKPSTAHAGTGVWISAVEDQPGVVLGGEVADQFTAANVRARGSSWGAQAGEFIIRGPGLEQSYLVPDPIDDFVDFRADGGPGDWSMALTRAESVGGFWASVYGLENLADPADVLRIPR